MSVIAALFTAHAVASAWAIFSRLNAKAGPPSEVPANVSLNDNGGRLMLDEPPTRCFLRHPGPCPGKTDLL